MGLRVIRSLGGNAFIKLARHRAIQSLFILAVLFSLTGGLLGFFPAPPQQNYSLNVMEECTRQVTQQFPLYGAVQTLNFHEDFIDPDDDGNFNPEAMELGISHVPYNYTGLVSLDWEGVGMDQLVLPNSQGIFLHARAQFVEAVKYFKRLRPNAQVGVYGIPRTGPSDSGQAWIDAAMMLQPIFVEVDCIFPSLYAPYAAAQPQYNLAADLQHVRNAVTLALMMAGSKPVHAFVMPRYHENNVTFGCRLIPTAEFMTRVAEIFNVSFNGRRVDGLTWFGDDRYYLWLSRQNLPPSDPQYEQSLRWRQAFAEEWLGKETDDEHFTRIHLPTLIQLSTVITSAPH